MENLADQAERALARHPAPALTLSELVRLIRGAGTVVTEPVLLRALEAESKRFRIVDPWEGPWASFLAAADWMKEGRSRDVLVIGRSVSAREGSPMPSSPVLQRLRDTVVHLGLSLDVDSASAVARWILVVAEHARVRANLAAVRPLAGQPTPADAARS
jgi:hypothetical protein